MSFNKKFFTTGGIVASTPPAAAGLDPLQNFETVTYTGNGGTQKITGYIRKGAAFNGSSSNFYISGSEVIDFTSKDYTISLFVNLSSNATDQVLISSWNNTTRRFQLATTSSNNFIIYERSSSNTTQSHTLSYTYSTNTWYHIGIVRNSTQILFYVNGSLEQTLSANYSIYSSGSNDLWFGKQENSIAPASCYNGKLDQIRLFDTGLDSSKISELADEEYGDSTVSTTDFGGYGGIALYQLDEDATDTGIPIDSGQSAVFSGSKIILNNYAVGDWNTGTKSISFWAKFSSFTDDHMIYTETNTSYLRGYINIILRTNKEFRIQYHQTNGANNNRTMFSASLTSIVADNWYHFAIVGNDSSTSLYLNGVSQTFTKSTGLNSSNSNTDLAGKFGEWDSSGGNPFNGSLDDFRVYSDGLTFTEVGYLASNDTTNISTINNLTAHYKFNGNATDSQGSNDGVATNITYSDPAIIQYNGTATNVDFLGMAFQPDLVWIKGRTVASNHALFDSVRGAGKRLESDSTGAEDAAYTYFSSFDSNGFTLSGNQAAVNGSYDYVAWCWKAAGAANTYNVLENGTVTSDSTASGAGITAGSITTGWEVSANRDAGFSIVKYTGSGNAESVGHGLSSAPEMIIVKSLGIEDWFVYFGSTSTPADYMKLNTTVEVGATSAIFPSPPTSTVFNQGGGSGVGANNVDHIAYCFHSVSGYQKIGSYSGNGSTNGPTITTGFRPRFLMVKRVDVANDWLIFDSVRSPSNPLDDFLRANTSDAESTNTDKDVDFLFDGFQMVNNQNALNASGTDNYIYLAIA